MLVTSNHDLNPVSFCPAGAVALGKMNPPRQLRCILQLSHRLIVKLQACYTGKDAERRTCISTASEAPGRNNGVAEAAEA